MRVTKAGLGYRSWDSTGEGNMNKFAGFLHDDSGQSTTEYAIILGVIVLAVTGLAMAFKDQLVIAWNKINSGMFKGF